MSKFQFFVIVTLLGAIAIKVDPKEVDSIIALVVLSNVINYLIESKKGHDEQGRT